MRFDNLHWTPIDAPAKGLTFKELNSESSEPKFTNLMENAVEVHIPENLGKLQHQFNQMLESFLHVSRKKLFNEATSSEILSHAGEIDDDDKAMQHKFFTGVGRNGENKDEGENEWKEFEKHVEIITQFMDISDENKNAMLDAMKKSFIALSDIDQGATWDGQERNPEAALEKGFKKLKELDEIFADAGLKGLEPAIRASRFLELLSPFYKTKEKQKTVSKRIDRVDKSTGEKLEYDISSFMKMLETRKTRNISNYLKDDGPYNLKNILTNAIRSTNRNQDSDDIAPAMTMEIFRKIVNQGGYSKNNAQVGKGEIALAMFFNDCSLPEKKGDIVINKQTKVEIKGNDSGITERTTITDKLLNMTYEDALALMRGHQSEIQDAMKRCKKERDEFKNAARAQKQIKRSWLAKMINVFDDIIFEQGAEQEQKKEMPNAKPQRKGEEINEARNANSESSGKDWRHGLLFQILFGMLATVYFNTFDFMLILNTDDNLNVANKDSVLFNSQMVKISMPKEGDWFENGKKVLNNLSKWGLTIRYENRSNDGTFKAIFGK